MGALKVILIFQRDNPKLRTEDILFQKNTSFKGKPGFYFGLNWNSLKKIPLFQK